VYGDIWYRYSYLDSCGESGAYKAWNTSKLWAVFPNGIAIWIRFVVCMYVYASVAGVVGQLVCFLRKFLEEQRFMAVLSRPFWQQRAVSRTEGTIITKKPLTRWGERQMTEVELHFRCWRDYGTALEWNSLGEMLQWSVIRFTNNCNDYITKQKNRKLIYNQPQVCLSTRCREFAR